MALQKLKTTGSRRSWPLLLTPDQAAQLLQTTRKTIYEKIRTKEIPVVHLGGTFYRIDRDALFWQTRSGGRSNA